MSTQPEEQPEDALPAVPAVPAAPAEASVEDERSADDRDEGWGERATGFDDAWYLEQRPPHWD